MNLRAFYQKIREIEETIDGSFAVVVSRETSDGGKAGVVSEVPRFVAARMVVEERAQLATAEQAAAYHKRTAAEAERAAQERDRARLQVAVFSNAELEQIRKRLQPRKA
jgi:hypothetical protein